MQSTSNNEIRNGGSSRTGEPEPKPFNFFIFDKPFIEHEESYSRSYEDDSDFTSGERRRGQHIPPSRLPAEFCIVKCAPSFIAHRDKARILPICCPYCLPKSKMQIAEVNKERSIENCLTVKAELKSNVSCWYTKWVWVPNILKYFWRRSSIVKQYDTVTYNDIKTDPELLQYVADYEQMNEEEQQTIKSKILSFVEHVCIIPMSRLRFMLSSWAVRLFLKCIFGAVLVHTGQIEHLKMTQNKGLPMVFIPLNRSVLDPIVLFAVLTHYNIPSPFFFSDDLMNTDSLLKKLTSLTGIRVAVKNDAVSDELALRNDIIYAGVSSYLRLLLKKGNNCELFIEPNRSKSGLPSTYLYGSEVVEILINLFESKQLEDAYIVPICTTYEKLPEGDEYLRNFDSVNQRGNDISYRNLFWKCLSKSPGNVRVDFGQPFSLREFKRELDSTMKWAAQTPLDGHCITIPSSDLRWNTDYCPTSSLPSFYGNLYTVSSDRLPFVNLLSNHAIYDASKCGAIMSTHILSFFLIKKYPNGLYLEKLIEEFESFQLLARDVSRDLGFRGNMEDVILRAIHILGPNLISIAALNNGKFVKAVEGPEIKLQLCYYANHVTPMFAREAVFATTLFSLFENSITIPAFVKERVVSTPVKEFAKAFEEVYKYLKAELFLHPPCKSPDDAILMCLDEFQTRGLLYVVEKKKHRDRFQESDDEWDSDPGEDRFQYNPDEVVITLNHNLINDNLIFWKNLVVGYLEVYRTSCLKLFEMLPSEEIEEQSMLNQMLEFSFKYSRRNICGDVLSSNTVQNFVNRMTDLNVVGYYNRKEDKKRYFFIMDEYASSDAIEKLYKSLDRLVFCP